MAAGAPARQVGPDGFPLSQAEILANLNHPGTGVPASGNVLAPASGAVASGGPGSVYSVGPNGQTSYNVTPNTQAYDANQAALNRTQQTSLANLSGTQASDLSKQSATQAQTLLNQRASLNAEEESRRISEISSLTGASGSTPHVSASAVPFDETGARNAAFARAKDTAGQTALSSLKALQDVVDTRGLDGSSIEAAGTGQVMAGAAGALGGFTREQLIQDLNRAASLSDRNYQGDITQRGQDMQMIPSLLSLITTSGLY